MPDKNIEPKKDLKTAPEELKDEQLDQAQGAGLNVASNIKDGTSNTFFRPNPAGDGTTEHFFTVEISEGR